MPREPDREKTVRAYRFKAKKQIALDAVEELKNKAKVTTKKAYAFKRLNEVKVALYQTLGTYPSRRPPTDSAGAASSFAGVNDDLPVDA